MAQLLPDISPSRQIILHSVTCGLTNASVPASSPGAMAVALLVGDPFATGIVSGGVYASQPWKSLNSTTKTTLRVVANLPGQKVPVQLDRTTNSFQVQVTSALLGTWEIEITTRYRLLIDTALTIYP